MNQINALFSLRENWEKRTKDATLKSKDFSSFFTKKLVLNLNFSNFLIKNTFSNLLWYRNS